MMPKKNRIQFTHLLLGAGALALLASLSGLWGRKWWGFDVLSHFHWQYLWLSAGLLLLAVMKEKAWLMGLAMVCLVVNAWYISPYLRPSASVVQAEAPHSMSVLFANVQINNPDVTRLVDQVRKTNPDIIVTSETSDAFYQALYTALPEYEYHWHGPGRGIYRLAFYSKLPPDGTMQALKFEGNDLPAMESVFTVAGQRFKVVGLHPNPPISKATTQTRDIDLDRISKVLETTKEPMIVVGDYNNSSYSWSMKAFESKLNLKDSRIGNGIQPTWPTMLPKLMRINLDHALVSEQLQVTDYRVLEEIGSDHSPIWVKVTW